MKFKIQNPKSKIAIVGAGPAGASLAIRLARENFDVCLIERERFPRYKLCGEFISPECLRHFRELGVVEKMLSLGGDRITQTIFYEPNGKSVAVPSKWFGGDAQGALSLSRAEMDFRLLERAKQVGVEVLEESSVVGVLLEKGEIRGMKIKSKDNQMREIFADLTIDATGRANVLAKLVEREISRSEDANAQSERKLNPENQKLHAENKSQIANRKSQIQNRLIGFKTYFKNVELEKGRCEIYFFRGGYGGLSFVENNRANHCFLIRADVVKEFAGDADKIVERVIFQNRRARETMENATPMFDWLAVSVDGFGLKNLNPAKNLFAVGDAAAFIDPFTGSGMLMAFESAEILAGTIAENSLAPEKIAGIYKILHRRRFQRRLRVCSLLRRAAFVPGFANFAVSALSLSRAARSVLARATRSKISDAA